MTEETRLNAVVRDSLPGLHALGPDEPFLWSSRYPHDVLDDIRHGRYDGRGPVCLTDLGLMPSVEDLLDATENPSGSLVAVAAPIDDVSHAYAELCQPDRVERNVAHQAVEPVPGLVWLLQLRGADWSLLIHSLSMTSVSIPMHPYL